LNVSFSGIEGENLLFGLTELALASGSACNSDSGEPSYVLRALGRDRETAQSSLRFSLGRGTSPEDIDRAAAAVRREVSRLQAAASARADASAVSGEAGTREQGTWVRFMLHTSKERIEEASHQVYGCPATEAVCDWLVTQLKGRSWSDPGLGGPQDWARTLDVPLDRLTRLLIVEDALRAALAAAQRQVNAGSTISVQH
jgi:cysteine desulfurase